MMHRQNFLRVREEIKKILDDPKLEPKLRLVATQQLIDLQKANNVNRAKNKKKPRKEFSAPTTSNLNLLAEKIEPKEEIQ